MGVPQESVRTQQLTLRDKDTSVTSKQFSIRFATEVNLTENVNVN